MSFARPRITKVRVSSVLSDDRHSRAGGNPGSFFTISLDTRFRGYECAREGATSARWKSVSEDATNSVAEGNCVAAKRGGEQPEANCWSVGERTRFGGELRRACSYVAKSETRWSRRRGVAMTRQPTWLETERQEGVAK